MFFVGVDQTVQYYCNQMFKNLCEFLERVSAAKLCKVM